MLPPALPPSSDNEEVEEDEPDIHTMRGELAEAGQSLQDGCREVERLKECLAAAKVALGAADGEVVDARAAEAAARTKLAGELILFASYGGLLLS